MHGRIKKFDKFKKAKNPRVVKPIDNKKPLNDGHSDISNVRDVPEDKNNKASKNKNK